MTSDEEGGRHAAPGGRRRRIRRAIGIVVWLWLTAELGDWLLLWVRLDARPSWGTQRAQQEAVRLQTTGSVESAEKGGPPAGGPFSVPHPYVGFVPGGVRSNLSAGGTGLCDDLLGDPTSPCYQEDRFVVGIGGGSFAAAVAYNQEELLVEGLEALPALHGQRVFLVRFAIPGQKQPQQLEALAYLSSLGVRFDLVLQIDGFNEIALHPQRNERLGVFAAYPNNWYPAHGARGDLDALAELAYVQRRRGELADAAVRSSLRWSWIYQARWHFMEGALRARYARELTRVEAAADGRGRRRSALLGPRRSYPNEALMYEDLVAIWARSSRLMHTLCAEAGAEFVHLLQPNQYVPGSKPLSDEERDIAWAEDSQYRRPVELAYPLLRAAGAELKRDGVRFVDAVELYGEVRETVYEDDCCHVNALGQQLVVRALLDELAE